MIEIGTDVELFHPCDLVWRALTDRVLLAKWFAEVTPAPPTPDRPVLRTAGLPGFDADVCVEVVRRQAPELLVLRWQEGDRRTRVTATLTPTGHGCRLTVHETLEHGDWDAGARAEHHQQAVGVRLPAILDWLAFQQVDLSPAEGGLTAELPVVRARTRAGRRRVAVIGALGVVALAGGAAVWAATRPTAPPRSAAPEATPLVVPTGTSQPTRAIPSRRTPATPRASASASVTAEPTPTVAPTRTPGPSRPPAVPLTGSYRTIADRVFGYRGEVVVTNPGSTARPEWAVTLTVGSGATVSNVNGAQWTQDGQVVTFTGTAVPAGGSTSFRFDVRDPDPLASSPEGCTVDGGPCAAG